MKLLILILIISPILGWAEECEKWYVKQLHNAFLIQSIGETTLAYRTFKNAYQGALKEGETLAKLRPVYELFAWYRTYGWSCKITAKPSNCLEEYGRSYLGGIVNSLSRSICAADGLTGPTSPVPRQEAQFESEWGKTPEQAKNIRMFIFGVSQLLSGLFITVTKTSLSPNSGVSLIATGIATMYSALNTKWTEHEKRRLELKKIEQKACQGLL